MSEYRFRILNVFARDGERLSGNPLAVFEDGRGLSDEAMLALALQFNLSETTFIFPAESASARVRIFTPTFEMPFAGHPTLGTAHVVRDLAGTGDALTLDMAAGVIPVTARGDRWTLAARAPTWRAAEASQAQLAEMLGLAPADLAGEALWVNTGSEQLVIPLASPEAIARAAPLPHLLERYGHSNAERHMAYVWAEAGDGEVAARFFFPKGPAVTEDPATGSACANLGGWFVASGTALPLTRTVRQGELVGRPSRLGLAVDAAGGIFVSGLVIELGRGVIRL